MQAFNMENADGSVALIPVPTRTKPHASFFPEKSRPYLTPSLSTPKFSTPAGTGFTHEGCWDCQEGTGVHKAYAGHTWS